MSRIDRTLRVGMIGPTLPFRGGIAQHTTRLHRALAERVTLTTLSFSRQYPKWLFPGQSDRDEQHEGHLEPGVTYSIDSLDPRTWEDAARRFADARVAAVIVPWWTVYFAPLVSYLKARLARSGIEVILLCHNVVDHEAALYKRMASRIVLSGVRGYCVHGPTEAGRLRELVPGARIAVHPHPIYDQYPAATGKFVRRAPLELLFFGFIRPYKGLDVLLDALASLERRDVRLSIVGEFWKDEKATLARIERLGLGDRVEVVSRFVREDEAAEYFARADLVVLPYRSATGSGIIPMAYHYGKPVLASRVGDLQQSVLEGQTGYLVEPESPRALAGAIARVTTQELASMRPHIEAFKKGLSWGGLAEAVLSLVPAAEPT